MERAPINSVCNADHPIQFDMQMRPVSVVTCLLLCLLCAPASSEAQHPSEEPESVPGELLVRLKELPSAALMRQGEAVGRLPDAADRVVQRLLSDVEVNQRVKQVEELFPRPRTRGQGRLQRMAVSEEADRLAAVRAKFPQRTQRIPKGAAPPRLDRIMKIVFEEPQADMRAVARQVAAHPEVEYAEPNWLARVLVNPNDPSFRSRGSWGQDFDDLWGLKKIQMPSAWDLHRDSRQITVAVIDTGIDYNHPDLAANIWFNRGEIAGNRVDDDGNGFVDDVKGWDFTEDDNDPIDGHSHGTHVSGTIAAVTNNNQGVAGINWNARLMAVKGLSDAGSGTVEGLTQAIVYAADNGADVLSNSWGGSGSSEALEDAMRYAHGLGCVIVAAAGNDNADAATFTPASISEVITVSAFDHRDKKASFSNYGTKIDVAAPGVDILSTYSTFIEPPLASAVNVVSNGNRYVPSIPLEFSAKTPAGGLTAVILDARLGDAADFQGQDFKGKIALIKRGERTFAEKVQHAADAGAVGVILYNNESGGFAGTLGDPSAIPAVSISQEEGQALLGLLNAVPATVRMAVATGADYYDHFSGTSMACPHVSGLAALIVAARPRFTNEQVRAIIRASSDDIVEPFDDGRRYSGFDIYAGYGRINAYQALQINAMPVAKLTSPSPGALIGGTVEIIGTATGAQFRRWVVEYGQGAVPTSWVNIAESTVPVEAEKLAVWDVSRLPYGLYTLRLQVFDAAFPNPIEDRLSLSVAFSFQRGWPTSTGGMVISSPALGDVDGDGLAEVVVGSFDQKVYAWRHDGTLLSGWPTHTRGNVASSPLLLDLDGVEGPEIVVGSNDGIVYAWRRDGRTVAGWPKATQGAVVSSPAAADVDGDGRPEIVVGSYDHQAYVWRSNGTVFPGWPKETGGPIVASAALADLNGDGKPEILIGSTDGKLYVWRADGTALPGWPRITRGPIVSSPAVGDVDLDGIPEIVCGSSDGLIYIWKPDGRLLSNWPLGTGHPIESSPALGDLDGDRRLEIVVGSFDHAVYAWHHTGFPMRGWPNETGGSVVASPVLADLNNDGFSEVVVGSMDQKVYAWEFDGKPLSGWPMAFPAGIESTAAVGDLDADGDLEVAFGSMDGQVYAFDLESGVAPGRLPWPMLKATASRTNQAEVVREADGRSGLLVFQVIASDPDGDPLTFTASGLPQGATFDPSTQVFRWQPTASQRGTHQVTFTVSDGRLSDSETITITVVATRLPSLRPIGNQMVSEGRLLEFVVRATDPDNEPLTYRAQNLPTGAGFEPSTGRFRWRPTHDQAGVYPRIRFEVGDGTSTIAEDITIVVMDAPPDTATPTQPTVDLVTRPTNVNPFVLTGTKEANASISINGEPVVAGTSSTMWSVPYRLSEGLNRLSITSQDEAGNVSQPFLVELVLDTLAPTVRITEPQEGAKIILP